MRGALLRALLAVYGAFLFLPLPWLFGIDSPVGTAIATVVGGIAGLLVTTASDPVDRFRSPRWILPLTVAPLVYLPAFGSHLEQTGIEGLVSPPAAALGAILTGVVAWMVASDRHSQQRRDAASTLVTVEARPSPGVRRTMGRLAVTLAGIYVAGGVGSLFFVGESLVSGTEIVTFSVPFLLLVVFTRRPQTVQITDEGFVVQHQLHDWDTFESYDVTDDTVTLSRRRWWQMELNFDRSDIENVDQFRQTLADYIPTAESHSTTSPTE